MSHNAAGLLWTSNLYLPLRPDSEQVKLSKKRTFKASFFSRKQLESKSLAEVQVLIENCGLVSQSNYLNNSNKECDWLILVCFIRELYTADAAIAPLKKKNSLV